MLFHNKLWTLKQNDKNRTKKLAKELGISKIAAQLLLNRGIDDINKTKAFIDGEIDCLHKEDNTNSLCFLEIDMELKAKDITFKFIEEIKMLKLFDLNNSKPLFAYKKITVENVIFFGENNQHIKLLVQDTNRVFDCVGINLGINNKTLAKGEKIDLVFNIELSIFKGIETINLNLVDLRRRCENGFKGNIMIQNYHCSFLNIFKKWNCKYKEFGLYNTIDLRNRKNRAEYVVKNIDSNSSNLILLNTIEGLIDLELYLSDINRTDIINSISFNVPKFNAKDMIVVNPVLEDFDFEKYENIYVYDIPITESEFNILISSGKRIYFLYNKLDIKAVKSFLADIVPNRNDLVDVYKYFKQLSKNKDMLNVSYEEIIEKISNMSYTKLDFCLYILSDAGLINYSKIENDLEIDLLPPPKKKIDITKIESFINTSHIIKNFRNFSKEAFTVKLK